MQGNTRPLQRPVSKHSRGESSDGGLYPLVQEGVQVAPTCESCWVHVAGLNDVPGPIAKRGHTPEIQNLFIHHTVDIVIKIPVDVAWWL